MKSLKPSMREKKRYLLIRGKKVHENIERAIVDFMGVLGSSLVGLKNIETGRDYVIVSVNRNAVDQVRASLCIWPEKMTVEKVSGTIKGLKLGKR